MASKTVSKRLLFIPLGLGLFFGLLNFLPAWHDLELGVFDLFLHMKPAIPQDKSIVLLDVDDASVDKYGVWPWPRQYMAQGLEVLTEFDARMAIFDIEYIDRSRESVDRNYLNEILKSKFDNNFLSIQGSISELLSAAANGSIPLSDVGDYANDLSNQIDQVKADLYNETKGVAVENDSYLAHAMRMFNRSFVAYYLNDYDMPPSTDSKLIAERNSVNALGTERYHYHGDAANKSTVPMPLQYFTFPIKEILPFTTGGGFANVPLDPDGKRRRIQLVNFINDKAYLQLVFSPFINLGGNPQLTLRNNRLEVKNLKFPDGSLNNLNIPVDDKGFMLINWPKDNFEESFKDHLPFITLLEYKETENALAQTLGMLELNESWKLLSGKNPITPALNMWNQAEQARKAALANGDPADRQAYIDAKQAFYELFGQLTASDIEQSVFKLTDEASAKAKPSQRQLVGQWQAQLRVLFKALHEYEHKLKLSRELLQKRLKGASCFIGWTSHSSTDLGVNPFTSKYANVGTHASLLNTILNKQFLGEAPVWLSAILSLVLALGLIFLIRRFKTGMQIAMGFGATALIFLLAFAFFAGTGTFVSIISPLLAVFTSFLSYSLAGFFISEQEKNFLRKAFSTYLSGDVINEIVNDPTMLKLGGTQKWLSAIFTDIKGFSTISEQLTPEALVHLLNIYLSGMSDIILANRGTIDKFVGDAIVGFFGAPVAFEDHARRVCQSAIEMRRKEAEMNLRITSENLSPHPLQTRIGINTGNMVVGNMGTESKMNYTIMGDAVNLAARLEGVNKQFGSWILSTGSTKDETGDDFAWRRLDRVRVVGIHQPVQLYELLDFKSTLNQRQFDMLARFDEALTVFETRNWVKAGKTFAAFLKDFPDEEAAKLYLKRCKNFEQTPPATDWDGVFNLTEK